MWLRGWILLVVASVLQVFFTSCGNTNSHGLDLVPVHGTITYQGKPLGNAQVVFLPETPGLLPAMGMTDASGRYELLTIVPGDGASLGKHRVTVTARASDQASVGNQPPVGLIDRNIQPGAPLIPERYFSFDTSGLTTEVTAQGVTADFDLTDRQ